MVERCLHLQHTHKIPEQCQEGRTSNKSLQVVTKLANIRYKLTYILLQEVRAFLSDASHLACEVPSMKRWYYDIFPSCRSPEQRDLEPHPEGIRCQSGLVNLNPDDCLRQLAFIECVGQDFVDLPQCNDELLSAKHNCKANESSRWEVLSEMHEAAEQRPIDYNALNAHAYAGARFLGLAEMSPQNSTTKSISCQSKMSARSAVRRIVEVANCVVIILALR